MVAYNSTTTLELACERWYRLQQEVIAKITEIDMVTPAVDDDGNVVNVMPKLHVTVPEVLEK